MACKTYRQRIYCPFHGMLQVLMLDGGIAESADGYHWKLYVADERIISHTGLSEVRYGTWNPQDGSSRSRVRGTAPSDLIEQTGERLVECLELEAGRIPFAPADRHEFWLLDEQHLQPLALLDSAIDRGSRNITSSPCWLPGASAKRDFSSTQGDALSLTEMIRQAAGKRPEGVWIERTATGGGVTDQGTHYAPAAFPALFIRTDWPDRQQAGLVRDFLAWQAPWLLQLASLIPDKRMALEQSAWQRAEEVSRVYRLYPQVVDHQGLTAARVKSRIINGSDTTVTQAEPFYPFFNE